VRLQEHRPQRRVLPAAEPSAHHDVDEHLLQGGRWVGTAIEGRSVAMQTI
jgi:hypothetical protein